MRIRTFLHVRPPFVDVAATTPFALLDSLKEHEIAYAVPSGPIETHGSVARSYATPPGAQALKGSGVSLHVAPPSVEKPATRPRAPPSDHRSCCHAPIRFPGSAGLTAIDGSTSAFA